MQKSYQAYQKNQVMTVSNDKLLLMLCNGLVRFIKNAQSAMNAGKVAETNNNLIKAQGILSELMASLDRDAGDFAENLFAIYEFMHRSLVEANVRKDGHQLQQILDMAVDLQETWNQVVQAANSHKSQTAAGAG